MILFMSGDRDRCDLGPVFEVTNDSFNLFPVSAAGILEVLRERSYGVGYIRSRSNRGVHKGTNRFAVRDVPHVVILARSRWGLFLREVDARIDRSLERRGGFEIEPFHVPNGTK